MLALRMFVLLAFCSPLAAWAEAPAPSRTIEFQFTPTARTQIALWIEKPDGTLQTVRLTQAVSYRGIGNRPGAAQMNSGFRWPYGRREGVLPIWAHRRAAAPGAQQFKRVIFQDRGSEGYASRTSNDSTAESYFCLSFTQTTTQKEALDAVTCASAFSSDKGRFLTNADSGYAEPAVIGGEGVMRPLDMVSLYPPRRDAVSCRDSGCSDTADVATYATHARSVMSDIDAVTMATPPEGVEQSVLFTLPADWPDGEYVAWLEVNVEGDYSPTFSAEKHKTPEEPASKWDVWALTYGYPYRGQPSVAFTLGFNPGVSGSAATVKATYYGDVDGFGPQGGAMHLMGDGQITDDPTNPATVGSGADRLLLGSKDYRFRLTVRGTEFCQAHEPPAVPAAVRVEPVSNDKHSHEWGHLEFVVPTSVTPIVHYEVRTSTTPITLADAQSFGRAQPAVAAKLDTEALMVPTGGAAGSPVEVDFGGLMPLTKYYAAIRAVNMCNVAGPYAVAEFTTTRINFTRLSGCFVATAAYGSALQPQVESLRTVRDVLRPRSPIFAAATDLYYRSGPAAAAVISRSGDVRAVVRTILGPVVDLAGAISPLVRVTGGGGTAEPPPATLQRASGRSGAPGSGRPAGARHTPVR